MKSSKNFIFILKFPLFPSFFLENYHEIRVVIHQMLTDCIPLTRHVSGYRRHFLLHFSKWIVILYTFLNGARNKLYHVFKVKKYMGIHHIFHSQAINRSKEWQDFNFSHKFQLLPHFLGMYDKILKLYSSIQMYVPKI